MRVESKHFLRYNTRTDLEQLQVEPKDLPAGRVRDVTRDSFSHGHASRTAPRQLSHRLLLGKAIVHIPL